MSDLDPEEMVIALRIIIYTVTTVAVMAYLPHPIRNIFTMSGRARAKQVFTPRFSLVLCAACVWFVYFVSFLFGEVWGFMLDPVGESNTSRVETAGKNYWIFFLFAWSMITAGMAILFFLVYPVCAVFHRLNWFPWRLPAANVAILNAVRPASLKEVLIYLAGVTGFCACMTAYAVL